MHEKMFVIRTTKLFHSMGTPIIGHVQRSNGYTEIKFTTMHFQELG
jgi:hypothetical protein